MVLVMPDLRNRSDHAAQLVQFWGARIAARRTELGLTQGDLADLIGTNPPTISRYESGKVEPRITVKVMIAEALGTTCEQLFRWMP